MQFAEAAKTTACSKLPEGGKYLEQRWQTGQCAEQVPQAASPHVSIRIVTSYPTRPENSPRRRKRFPARRQAQKCAGKDAFQVAPRWSTLNCHQLDFRALRAGAGGSGTLSPSALRSISIEPLKLAPSSIRMRPARRLPTTEPSFVISIRS